MARKPNYDFERRRREQERRKKKDEKREERQRRKEEGGDSGDVTLASAEELAALGLPMPVVDRLPDELEIDESSDREA